MTLHTGGGVRKIANQRPRFRLLDNIASIFGARRRGDVVSDARNVIHASLTAVLAGIAVILATPGATFSTSHSFDLMARMMSEDAWAMAFWAVASFGAMGMTTLSLKFRLASVLALSTMHGVFALCLALANPMTTGTMTYSILASQGYYLVWRRTREGV